MIALSFAKNGWHDSCTDKILTRKAYSTEKIASMILLDALKKMCNDGV